MGQGTVGWVLGHSQGCTKGSSEGKLLGTASLCSASWEHQRIGAVHTLSNPAPILPSQALLKTAGKSWPLLLINQVLYIYIYIKPIKVINQGMGEQMHLCACITYVHGQITHRKNNPFSVRHLTAWLQNTSCYSLCR